MELPLIVLEMILGLALLEPRNTPANHADSPIDGPPRALPAVPAQLSVMAGSPTEAASVSQVVPNEPNRGRTPMSANEARVHLELAYRSIVNEPPRAKTLALLLAQWALETGIGQNMWGYNYGGLKATSGGAEFGTGELIGGRRTHAVHRFRTYPCAMAGAMDYVGTLRRNFPKSFAALQRGHAARFVQALVEERYFTGDPTDYGKAIAKLAEQYERRWSELDHALAEAE